MSQSGEARSSHRDSGSIDDAAKLGNARSGESVNRVKRRCKFAFEGEIEFVRRRPVREQIGFWAG